MILIAAALTSPTLLGAVYFWFNRGQIEASESTLVFKMRPLPFPWDKRFSALGVKQFFPHTSLELAINQALVIITKEDYLIRLGPFPSKTAVRQVAHSLQDFYGLTDQPVYEFSSDEDVAAEA